MDGIVICYATCWPCKFGDCPAPRQWHTWADSDDVEWALKTEQKDPREQRCGCSCTANQEREGS